MNTDIVMLQEGTHNIADLHLELYKNRRLVIKGIGNVVLTSSDGQGIVLDTLAASSLTLENISFSK
jgi:hypothetical protein